jgi:hypothetical protein
MPTTLETITDVRLIALEAMVSRLYALILSNMTPANSIAMKEQMVATAGKWEIYPGTPPQDVADTELRMADNEIDFNAPASLRIYPSLNGQRNPDAEYPIPYLLYAGTLDECIKEFMFKPASLHHLYEIHTNPQPPLVTEVMGAEHVVELARLRDFL